MMLMMRIGKMDMGVCQRFMVMPVPMPGSRRNRNIVRMLVVRIVRMLMLVLQYVMRMCVYMSLAKVQPDADSHE